MARTDRMAYLCSLSQTNRAQRDRRGASDEVVCVLAHAFGFESADDYGRANEAALSRLRARAARDARRARALTKVNAFVPRHGLACSPPTILEQEAQEQSTTLRVVVLHCAAPPWCGSCMGVAN